MAFKKARPHPFDPRHHIFGDDAAKMLGYNFSHFAHGIARKYRLRRYRSGQKLFFVRSEVERLPQLIPNFERGLQRRQQMNGNTAHHRAKISAPSTPMQKRGALVIVASPKQIKELIESGVNVQLMLK